MDGTQWKSVVGMPGRYEVSNGGDVKSLLTSRILKPGTQSRGYKTVLLYDGSSPKAPKSHTVHSIVAAAFIGPRPDGMTINHRDGDKGNNRVGNLEYCTMRENIMHGLSHGLSAPPRSSISKLTEHDVRIIRAIFAADPPRGTQACLARAMGVDESTIRNVRSGKYYRSNG